MKKRILIVGGIIVAVGAAGAGGWYYYQNRSEAVSGEVAYVSTVSALTGSASGVENRYAGVIEPQETVEVSIENGRKVTEVQVKTGDEVKKGQILFEYDLSSMQEDLQEANLELDRLKNEELSLNDQLKTLEAEKKKASKDNQLSYTIEIKTNQMNLQKNQYDQKSKAAEIEKLENAMGNTEVRSEIDGIIQKIDTTKLSNEDGDSLDSDGGDYYYGNNENNNAFITILSTGAYRVKGTANEQNMDAVESMEGENVIIRSRADENEIWHGVMGAIDRENANQDSNNSYYFGMMDSSGDSQTNSSSYPFYVELDSSEGLMLGQHVYIERDNGQADKKEGLWLAEYYIVDAESESPFVWAANDKERLEKRTVTLGQYDEELQEYEILDGLSLKDCIAFPAENLVEGMVTQIGSGLDMSDEMYDDGMYDNEYEDGMYEDDFDNAEYDEGMDDMNVIDMNGEDFSYSDEFIEDPMDDAYDAGMDGLYDEGMDSMDDMGESEDFSDMDMEPMEESPQVETSEGEALE